MAETGLRRVAALACTREIAAHQKTWFAEIRARAGDGEPVAVVSADSPHELFRALDIPYIVVQWWSSVLAAKQLGPRYLARLAEAGYPDDREQYNALPFGEVLDGGGDGGGDAAWGGLPHPTFLQCALGTDGLRHLFEAWADECGARFFPLERTVDIRPELPVAWWDELPHHWDRVLPAERLDALAEELEELAGHLARATRRRFSRDRLEEVMALANAQAEANRRARDTIAASPGMPVPVGETMPAVMIPQWHRGSPWARDAAQGFAAEVERRCASVEGGGELRLMWLGRGLWSSLGFYDAFRASGADFVWSMYLGLAADGYARYLDGRDPLRALASRFVPMGEELRMPTWSSAWHLKEARLHRVDGAVSVGEDAYFSARLLEAHDIPVLEIAANNVDRRTWDETGLTVEIARFLDERVRPARARRTA